MTCAWLQFTSRRRDPRTGKRYQWRHGPFVSLSAAKDHEWAITVLFVAEPRGGPPGTKPVCRCERCLKVEIVVTGRGPWGRRSR